MSFTLSQFRARIMAHMDATNADGTFSGRWDTTLGGEVDQKLAVAFDREWKRILNANRHYRLAERTPTSDANGKYLISDLSTATQRFYRLVTFLVDNLPYREAVFEDVPIGAFLNTPNYEWYREGDYIVALPITASKQASVWVNHLPKSILSLADADTVTFPEGYEDVPALEAAAALLFKGGAETQAGVELQGKAEEMRRDMLQDLARFSVKPTSTMYTDSAVDWAG